MPNEFLSSQHNRVGTSRVGTSRLPQVGTTIFTVMSALAAKHGAVNLGQGFPDFNCDERLQRYFTEALAAGHNQYAPMTGVPPASVIDGT